MTIMHGRQRHRFNSRQTKADPWLPEEYIYLGGMPHVYTVDFDGMQRVYFPGGGHVRLEHVAQAVTKFPDVPRVTNNRTKVLHDTSVHSFVGLQG